MRADDVRPGHIVYVKATTSGKLKYFLCVQEATSDFAGLFMYVNSEKEEAHRNDYRVRSTRLGILDRGPDATSMVSFGNLVPMRHKWLSDPFNKGRLVTFLEATLARELLRFCTEQRTGLDPDERAMLRRVLEQCAERVTADAAE